MATKAQQRKMQKRKAREKRIKREHNIRRNNAPAPADRYWLDIFFDGKWHAGVMTFPDWDAVLKHRADTEVRRANGEHIVAGRVVDLRSGSVVMEIAQSEPKPIKGEMQDGMADAAADKAVPDRAKEVSELGIG